MTAYGRFQKSKQVRVPDDEPLRWKWARQAVLSRVRRQRVIAAKKLAAKGFCYKRSDKHQDRDRQQ